MRLGKLSNDDLQRLVLRHLGQQSADFGAGIGRDCAVITVGGQTLALSTDPITIQTPDAGRLAVLVCLNDAAAAGATPEAILLTVLCPESATEDLIENTIVQAAQTAKAYGVPIVGGHTEVTDAVTRLVLSATVVASVGSRGPIPADGMRDGDAIVLTKWAGLEGTLILAKEKSCLRCGGEAGAALALEQHLCVLPESQVGAKFLQTHAMHDVTEGGVLGAIWEMAEAANLGVDVVLEDIPVLDVTRKLCQALDIDPYRLIGSGSLLIATSAPEELCRALAQKNIFATVVAKATTQEKRVQSAGVWQSLTPPQGDALYSAF